MKKGEKNKDKIKKGERNKDKEIGREKKRKLFKLEHTDRGSKLMNHLLHLSVH